MCNPADCVLFDAAPWVSYQPLATAAYAFPAMVLPLGEKRAQPKIYFVLDRLYWRIVFDGEVQLRRPRPSLLEIDPTGPGDVGPRIRLVPRMTTPWHHFDRCRSRDDPR